MPESIVDMIDHAIADCEMSPDAMRWMPEDKPETPGPSPYWWDRYATDHIWHHPIHLETYIRTAPILFTAEEYNEFRALLEGARIVRPPH